MLIFLGKGDLLEFYPDHKAALTVCQGDEALGMRLKGEPVGGQIRRYRGEPIERLLFYSERS
jgi:hypothetical protein